MGQFGFAHLDLGILPVWTDEIRSFEEGDVIGMDSEKPGKLMVIRWGVVHYLDFTKSIWGTGCATAFTLSNRPNVS